MLIHVTCGPPPATCGFVLIPAGVFTMGDAAARPDERPPHRVYVSAFEIAVLPVTNRDFAAFIEATGHEPPRFWDDAQFNTPRQPVVGVIWHDGVAYCEWMSGTTGRHYRLPTEAEREKASRGGREGAAYPWGDTPEGGGVFSAETVLPAGLTHADTRDGIFAQAGPFDVGLSRPNLYGLLDIAYNIHEWCSDWYDPTYYAESPTHDPRGPMSGKRRVSRGGAWRHQVKICRNSARSSLVPEFRYNDYGFRLARDP